MKKILLLALFPFLCIMSKAQSVNVIYFPDNGGAAYVKNMNIDDSDPNTTLIKVSGVVGTESSISINLDPANCIDLTGKLISSTTNSDGTTCIECKKVAGKCATICKIPLINIQNATYLGDAKGTVVYSNTAGYTTDENGDANGAICKGDISTVATGSTGGYQMPRPVLGMYTQIDTFGNTYCVQCVRGPGYCITYMAGGTPSNRNDWNW